MLLIIKNLNASITIEQIEQLLIPAISGNFFQRAGAIHAIKIMGVLDKQGKPVEVHALVRVTPSHIKKRVLKNLKAQSIDGKKLEVSEYVARRISNDRRNINDQDADNPASNRRIFQRRLTNADMVTLSEKTY